MPKVFDENGNSVNVAKEQLERMLEAGYTQTPPEVEAADDSDDESGNQGDSDDETSAEDDSGEADGDINATKGAVELAEQEGVDLEEVEGTGAGGRITKQDVEASLAGDDED